jgi:lipopolysaccharide export system permease protein
MISTATTTLFRYISRQFLVSFALLLLILLGLVYVFETIELLRRAGNLSGVPFSTILKMGGLKLPYVGQIIVPFAVLFAAIHACWKLNKTSELVVIRAAGLSAWQFLSPMIIAAFLIGIAATAVVNPAGAILLSRFEQMEMLYLQKNSNLVTVARTGIWLRQPVEGKGYALVHSASFDPVGWKLNDVSVLFFDAQDTFQKRADSQTAYLREGYWALEDASVYEGAQPPQHVPVFSLPTALTTQQLEESFADPETISFWNIPEYIHIMKQAGFSGLRLQIYYQSLLAKPFFFAAMILLAATFSLRPQRFGGTGAMIALGVGAGFFIFFMESVLQALGLSQKIPVYLAAWTPAMVSLLLGSTAILYLEDG